MEKKRVEHAFVLCKTWTKERMEVELLPGWRGERRACQCVRWVQERMEVEGEVSKKFTPETMVPMMIGSIEKK